MDGVLFARIVDSSWIDEQTAFARKPDHQLAALQEKSPLRRN